MFPDSSDLCYKCQKYKGTLVHLFWECEYIQQFWRHVHAVTQQFTGKTFVMSPSLYLLNLCPDKLFDNVTQSMLMIMMSLARKCVLLKWATLHLPPLDLWFTQLSSTIPLEKLTYERNGKQDMFWKIWTPVHIYLNM
ncbi:hypothetical protein NL108_018597 [Boleophthalmus pectinirostris]|nr:hypothetical protein NL108_018597 [Boleophthalmus pectinirostris]